jgi:hypothetical protein
MGEATKSRHSEAAHRARPARKAKALAPEMTAGCYHATAESGDHATKSWLNKPLRSTNKLADHMTGRKAIVVNAAADFKPAHRNVRCARKHGLESIARPAVVQPRFEVNDNEMLCADEKLRRDLLEDFRV